ncbi:MAG: hypothetical protein KC586_00595, partial [Myxococcales bacterium]|nr:hypothetical protein [Myxococcales bacterium]
RENTDAIVANIPGLPGRPRWPTMLLAFAIGAAAVVGGVMAWRAATATEVATPTELERVEAALAAGRFDGAPGDDVLTLTAVLASNGAAEDARRLRDEATRRLREAARGTLDRERAREAWTRLLAFVPDDVEALERRAALDAPPDPEPGLHLPSDVRAGDEVTLEVVLGEGTYAEGARFELYRGNRRVARLDAVRAGVERRWLGTTTIRTSGSYEVRFTVGGLEEPVKAPLEVSRASNAPRRSTETPRTTVLRTTPQTTAMEELPPPVVVEDDGIDWTIPANMGGATMTSTPPPDPGAPPPWTG